MSQDLHALLRAVKNGSICVEDAALQLKMAPFEDLGYAKIDLHRAARQSGHRLDEARDRIRRFADGYFASLRALDKAHDETWNDLHMLFGACCALAEIQLALPGEVRTTVPLRSVLDRRPFI